MTFTLPQAALAACAAAAALAAAPAMALTGTPVTLDFEGVESFSSVAEYYNGGTDGAGNTAAINIGASFSGAVLALSNDVLGPYYSNAPTPGAVAFATDDTAVLNISRGFIDQISFYYSAASSALDVVKVYSGLDGSGSLLGAVSLSANAQLNGCSDTAFCHWQRISLGFAGVGQSLTLGGNAGNVAFDNLMVSAVPEPTTVAMLAIGLAAISLSTRRRPR